MNPEEKTADSKGSSMPPAGEPTPADSSTSKPKSPMMMWVGIVLAVLVVGGGAWWYMMSQVKTPVVQKVYKVGVLTVDGVVPNSSVVMKQGSELAEKLGKTDAIDVQLIFKQTDCDPTKAKTAVTDLAAQGVVGIVGEFCSGATLAAAPIANAKHVPLISGASTSPALTTAGAYVYRTIASDAGEASYIAGQMYNKYNVRKLALLHENDVFGIGYHDALKSAFEKLGGTIVSDEVYEPTAVDMTTQLTRAKATKPDAFFTVGTYANTNILVEKQQIGFAVPAFGPEYFSFAPFSDATAGAAEGLVLPGATNGSRDFVEKFTAQFGTAPSQTFAATNYDATLAIIEALKAGATSGETVKQKLDSLSFTGATGTVKFDSNGDVPGSFSLEVIKSGKATPVQ